MKEQQEKKAVRDQEKRVRMELLEQEKVMRKEARE